MSERAPLLPARYLATATALNGGTSRCDACGEHMLEDERHWHTKGGDFEEADE